MASDKRSRIEFLSVAEESGDDAVRVVKLAEMVNAVYAEAEKGLWIDGAQRTNSPEINALIEKGELAAAFVDESIVGCVQVRRLDDRIGEFGMLVVSPQWRSVGVGRQLIEFAEERCRTAGLGVMQLELLVPREWTHPFKEYLARWYGSIGYRQVGLGAIEESYSHLAPLLATPCDFVVYQKDLSPSFGSSENIL